MSADCADRELRDRVQLVDQSRHACRAPLEARRQNGRTQDAAFGCAVSLISSQNRLGHAGSRLVRPSAAYLNLCSSGTLSLSSRDWAYLVPITPNAVSSNTPR